MMEDRMKMLKAFCIITDAGIIIFAYLTAYYLRFHTPLFNEELVYYYPLQSYTALLIYLIPIYLFSLFIFRQYNLMPIISRLNQIIRIVLSNMVGIIIFITLLYVQKENNISRKFLILFLIINTILTIGSRMLISSHTKRKLKVG